MPILPKNVRGFYAIVDGTDMALAESLINPLTGGAKILQLRNKTASSQELHTLAEHLLTRCKKYGALFVVNDRLDVALASGADGIHLGQDDLPLEEATTLARSHDLILGYSTHTTAQVEEAIVHRPSYLGFGPIFPTQTKTNPDPTVGIQALQQATSRAKDIPVFAIGGINLENALEIAQAGATGLCAVNAVLAHPKPGEIVRKFSVPFLPS